MCVCGLNTYDKLDKCEGLGPLGMIVCGNVDILDCTVSLKNTTEFLGRAAFACGSILLRTSQLQSFESEAAGKLMT